MIRFSIRSLPYRLRTARPEAFTFLYMIEYHTIFILKKTDRFFKTFRSPLPENSAGAADEAPLRSCGSPCIAPSWGDAKCFGGGKTHEIRILTQLCAGQRAKIWRRGKDFFGKSSLKNAHFCYNSSKVPLCGGPARQTLKARCAFLSACVTCKTMTRMVLLWPLRGDIML